MRKIILLSDTHNYLDKKIFPYLETCDEIWHAGDIGNWEIINQLNTFAKVRAVYGNIDGKEIRSELEESLQFTCGNMKILMQHIGGYPGNYAKNIRNIIIKEDIDIFISGHSHILKVIYDKELNVLHMNPGSIGNYGHHKVKTIISFIIENKKINDMNVIEFPRS